MEKIGVFICDCGTNIAEVINTKEVAEFAAKQPGVVEVKIHRLWCSEQGREEMQKVIKEKGLTRIAIAACSPKQHELTFQKVLKSSDLNPYFMQMANIREQVAWVTKNGTLATKKAKALLKAAIKRLEFQEPLEQKEIDCNNDIVVIGAGAAGMSAALTLAQKKRKVYLIEKEPWIGGKVVSYEDVLPNLECAPCMLEPLMDKVLHHENIELLTASQITNVKGFFGNFEVTVSSPARFVDKEKCIGCNACFDVCPVKTKNKFNGNLSERHAVYTAFAGLLPNVPIIDKELCLRFKGENCAKCAEACSFAAIDYSMKDTEIQIKAGGIVIATGFGLLDISSLNFPKHPNIITAFQCERLIASNGPTDGALSLENMASPPSSIAFLHCAGSRDKRYKEYCSGICCAYTLKLAHLIKKKYKDIKIYEIYSDWCLAGKGYQEFYDKCSTKGTEYIRVSNPNDVQIKAENNKLSINTGKTINVDMLVLSPAVIPSADTAKLADILGIPLDKDGFFASEHSILSSAASTLKGIYIAGCAGGPKDISQSVLQSHAASGKLLSENIIGEKIPLEIISSYVDENICSGCRMCMDACSYQAISIDKSKNKSTINEALCRGCGVCAAGCTSGAIKSRNFTTKQIFSEIEGVLDD